MDGHAVILLVKGSQRGAQIDKQILRCCDTHTDVQGFIGIGIETKEDTVMELSMR